MNYAQNWANYPHYQAIQGLLGQQFTGTPLQQYQQARAGLGGLLNPPEIERTPMSTLRDPITEAVGEEQAVNQGLLQGGEGGQSDGGRNTSSSGWGNAYPDYDEPAGFLSRVNPEQVALMAISPALYGLNQMLNPNAVGLLDPLTAVENDRALNAPSNLGFSYDGVSYAPDAMVAAMEQSDAQALENAINSLGVNRYGDEFGYGVDYAGIDAAGEGGFGGGGYGGAGDSAMGGGYGDPDGMGGFGDDGGGFGGFV